MLKFSLAAGAATLALVPASAQAQTFTGPYIGVHIGYATGTSDADGSLGGNWLSETTSLQAEVSDYIDADLEPNGLVYGLQAGYDYQTPGNFVVGIEGDFSVLDADDDRDSPLTATTSFPALQYAASNEIDVKSMFSLRGKAGYAFGNSMLYADAGWAWVKSRYSAALSSNGGYNKAGSQSDTTDGFIVGLGFEHRVGKNVSLRLDYHYTDQGETDFTNDFLAGSTFPGYVETYEQDLKLHVIRTGLNFRF
jgi:opacity protein-like surface antigen